MYTKTTKKINITVNPYFLEDQSEPEDQHFVWAYQVTINNMSKESVQLKNRYWKIIDSNGTKAGPIDQLDVAYDSFSTINLGSKIVTTVAGVSAIGTAYTDFEDILNYSISRLVLKHKYRFIWF